MASHVSKSPFTISLNIFIIKYCHAKCRLINIKIPHQLRQLGIPLFNQTLVFQTIAKLTFSKNWYVIMVKSILRCHYSGTNPHVPIALFVQDLPLDYKK